MAKKPVDVCCIVSNSFLQEEDRSIFFRGVDSVEVVDEGTTMLDLLVKHGIFSSKGQAKKNGWAGAKSKIPPGFSETTVGKLKHCITILNPTE